MKGVPIPYSDEEMAWLEVNRMMILSDYTEAFNARFGRDLQMFNLNALRKRKGWRVGRAKGRTKGRRLNYSDAEIAWLRANGTMESHACVRAFCKKFGRDDFTFERLKSLRTREGVKTGRTGCFMPGNVPANKGKRCPEGKGGRHPNARRTQFKKGQPPRNVKYPGHERVNVYGYVEVSVQETNPYTGFERRYVLKHRWLWEKKHGPIPPGMRLKCRDGDKLNTDPSNWEVISPGALAVLNNTARFGGLDHGAAPVELKPAVIAVAKLKHAVRRKERAA